MTTYSLIALAPPPAPTGEGGEAVPGNPLMSLFPLIPIFIIMYFLMIRPQQKRQKEHQKKIQSLQVGDQIITSGGIHGRVSNIKDRSLMLKIADNVKIEMDKSAVATILSSEAAGSSTETKGAS